MILQKIRTMLLNIEQVRCSSGSTRAVARAGMARELGIGPGTLENLIRDRVKTVSADNAANIIALWVKTIEAKIAQLEHQRRLAHEVGMDLDASHVGRLDAHLDAARALLAEAPGKKGGAR
jgi:hypothetical protein